MDAILRQLKRAVTANPHDVETLHVYIGALERLVVPGPKVVQKRPGWKCEGTSEPGFVGTPSPDGVCAYFSVDHVLCERLPGDGPCGPGCHRVVRLLIDGEWTDYPLPVSYSADNGESEDWCIFCGDPSERK